ncbi:MAG: TlpA family protein disulfide reductase [candidate division WOR-3 bacterium]|nr:TlpA family protein disulfide reductase [candidate division WOR-3 bacterium]MDW8113504.1 TlpA disulfide reductase family protein [candidate division WOR-3 bacterium]
MRAKNLIIFILFFFIYAQQNVDTLRSYKKAPSFWLYNLNKEKIYLDSLLNKGPIFISFWALWCKLCIQELDAFKKIYDQYETLGLKVLAISEDGPKAINKVKSFVKGKKWKYEILLDTDGKVRELFGVGSIMPTSFILDKKGNIRLISRGYKKGDEKKFIKVIEEILNEEKN